MPRFATAAAVTPWAERPPPRELRVEAVSSLGQLQLYADAWDALAERVPQRVHALSHAWIASSLEHELGAGESFVCFVALEGERLLGVLSVVLRPGRMLGCRCTRLRTPCSFHTMATDLVCQPGREGFLLPRLVAAVAGRVGDWAELRCGRLSELSPTLAAGARADHGCLCHHEAGDRGSFVRTVGPFEEYERSLGAHFARNLRRVRRKLAAVPGVEVEFLQGAQARPELLDAFLRLEAAGWKGATGSAILNRPRLVRFYEALVQRLAARGWLEWHLLRLRGRIIAAHFALRMGSCLYLWKIAFDEEFSALAPGNVLMARTLERAFAAPDIEELNCVTDTAWNRNWNMRRRSYYDLSLWPARALPLLAGYVPCRARELARQVPGARLVYARVRALARGAEALGRRAARRLGAR
jgi:CelD/BcsL family acetyltransferase involved in cellulose biosynthesis